jgi:hypothetical protein
MKSYLLPDGRIFVPTSTMFEGMMLDQYEAIESDSDEARAAAPWTVPATPEIIEMYERHLEAAKKLGTDGVTKE